MFLGICGVGNVIRSTRSRSRIGCSPNRGRTILLLHLLSVHGSAAQCATRLLLQYVQHPSNLELTLSIMLAIRWRRINVPFHIKLRPWTCHLFVVLNYEQSVCMKSYFMCTPVGILLSKLRRSIEKRWIIFPANVIRWTCSDCNLHVHVVGSERRDDAVSPRPTRTIKSYTPSRAQMPYWEP